MQIAEGQSFDASTGVSIGVALAALWPGRKSAIGGEDRTEDRVEA